MVLAAETIEHQVFPEPEAQRHRRRQLRRVHQRRRLARLRLRQRRPPLLPRQRRLEENYSEINLQPGYQKLCYDNALSYVRYRHLDSDFVRVARQQDFLRDLREQISPEDVIGQIDKVAKAVGHAIASTFHSSASELIELAKLIAFSQGKPLRQVKFRALDQNAQIKGGSYVTTTPALAEATLNDFLHGAQKLSLPRSVTASKSTASRTPRLGHRLIGRNRPVPDLVGRKGPAGESRRRPALPGPHLAADRPGDAADRPRLRPARQRRTPPARLHRRLAAEQPGRLLRHRGHRLA